MAAKNKAPLPELGQEDDEQCAMTAETLPQEQFVSGDDELNPAGAETEPSGDTAIEEAAESVINLEPALSIQNVVKLYEKLKKSYAAHDYIEIDASHVTSIDTATLQLFVALKKDSLKQNKEVNFFQPSPRFIESARLLDLINALDIIDV